METIEKSAGQRTRAVSVTDAAAMTSLSRSSIYELMTDGKLRSAKVGKRRLVLVESIDALLASSEVKERC